jgi:hypothetical protein
MKLPAKNSKNFRQDHCLSSQNLLALQENERLKLALDLQDTIVHDLAALKAMSHTIEINSTPTQGTKIFIEVPRQEIYGGGQR